MTATTSPRRLDVDTHAVHFAKAMNGLEKVATRELDGVDFDVRLRELVRIRASQLNGCSSWVDVHTRDALAASESPQRLFALTVWVESACFTPRERAALAFTETVT